MLRCSELNNGQYFKFTSFNSPIYKMVNHRFYLNIESNELKKLFPVKDLEVIKVSGEMHPHGQKPLDTRMKADHHYINFHEQSIGLVAVNITTILDWKLTFGSMFHELNINKIDGSSYLFMFDGTMDPAMIIEDFCQQRDLAFDYALDNGLFQTTMKLTR